MWRVFILIVAFAGPGWAADVTFSGRMEQGGLVVGMAHPGAKVIFSGRSLPTMDTGRFLLGLNRDAPRTIEVVIETAGGLRETVPLTIASRDWKIERVDGVPQKLVTPDRKTAAKIAVDSRLMAAARSKMELTPFFETGFIRPAEGRISGVFGSQRVLNGLPRAPHLGLDIAAPQGTPIRAAADGVVSLVNTEMTLTGQTVFINHGHGLQSLYIHMSAIHVEDGQRVNQGDVIGKIGMTGRATGPHLHFGITWFDTRLDPETVLAALPAETN
jgi:hypothetical protein